MPATKKTAQTNGTKTPDFIVYSVMNRGEAKPAQWNRLGAAWMHEDGNGLNIQLNTLPLNFHGALTLRVPLANNQGAGH